MIRVPTRGLACLLVVLAILLLVPASVSAQGDVAVVTSVAPIYAAPRVTKEPLRVAAVGSTLIVVGQQGDWARVKFEDRQIGERFGWVQYTRIKLHEQATVTAGERTQDTVALVTSLAPIYLYPQVMQEPLRVVAVDSTLTVISQQGDWAEVRFKDPKVGERYGWIQRADITVSETTPSRPSAQGTLASPRTSLPSPAPNTATSAAPRSLPTTPAASSRPRPVVRYQPPPTNTTSGFYHSAPLPPYMIPLLAVGNAPVTPVPPHMIPFLALPRSSVTAEGPDYALPSVGAPYTIPPLPANSAPYLLSPVPVTPSVSTPTLPTYDSGRAKRYTITPTVPGTNVPDPRERGWVVEGNTMRPELFGVADPTKPGWVSEGATWKPTLPGTSNVPDSGRPGWVLQGNTMMPTLAGTNGVPDSSRPGWVLQGNVWKPTLPGATVPVPDSSRPGFVIVGDMAYPTLPGTNVRDYSKPGWRIQ